MFPILRRFQKAELDISQTVGSAFQILTKCHVSRSRTFSDAVTFLREGLSPGCLVPGDYSFVTLLGL